MRLAFDTSVPPPLLDRRGKPSIRPFASMPEGASFPVSADQVEATRCAAYAFSKRNPGYRFTVRRGPDGTHRCWRVRSDS